MTASFAGTVTVVTVGTQGPPGPASVLTPLVVAPGAPLGWDAQPLASTEFMGDTTNRWNDNLATGNTARIVANVLTPGAAAAQLALEYSLDNSAWVATGAVVAINAAGVIVGAWVALPAAAKVASVYLRLTGSGGDGATTPVFGSIKAQVSP